MHPVVVAWRKVDSQERSIPVNPGAVGITERNVRALKYREHEPSHETAVRFGFAYPSVGNVYAYWEQRMTQADFFEPETQSAFWRDYNRAGNAF